MHSFKTASVAFALACAACGQGNPDNVMSPEANALAPAEVNAALGPEVNAADMNLAANDVNGTGTTTANSPSTTGSAANNSSE